MKGYKIVPYCPRCGTPLSSHEVAQGYKDVKERSAIAKFKVVGEDAYILAWTTTPWTLPSNVALCVNPDETYVKVKVEDGHRLLPGTGTVLTRFWANVSYEVLETYKGKDLEYKEYEPLYNCAKSWEAEKAYLRCLRYLCNYERWYRCRSYRTGFR